MIDYVPLGRWTRTERATNGIKVDFANTDHCGTCPVPLPFSKKAEKKDLLATDLNKSKGKSKE